MASREWSAQRDEKLRSIFMRYDGVHDDVKKFAGIHKIVCCLTLKNVFSRSTLLFAWLTTKTHRQSLIAQFVIIFSNNLFELKFENRNRYNFQPYALNMICLRFSRKFPSSKKKLCWSDVTQGRHETLGEKIWRIFVSC